MAAASSPTPIFQLKALSVGELLDYATKLYKDNFLLFFAIAGVAEVISFASLPVLSLLRGVSTSSPGEQAAVASISFFGWLFAFFIATVLSQAATTFAVAESYFERPITVMQSYRRSAPFLWRLIRIGFEVGLRVGLASLALIIPGILLTLKYSVVVPVAVLEDEQASDAIARSSELTAGQYKRIFPIYVLFWILSFAFTSLLRYPSLIPAVMHLFGPAWLQSFFLVGKFIAGTIVQPVLTISLALLYFDLRVRKEGFDLQLMLQQMSPQVSELATPASLPPASPAH